jgi:hypothetical protein
VEGPAHAGIRVQRWDVESNFFTVQSSAADHVVLRLFSYPAWSVRVNGREVTTSPRAGTGQMLVPVEVGMNRVEIRFGRTPDRTAGGGVSLVAVVGLLGWRFWSRRHAAV